MSVSIAVPYLFDYFTFVIYLEIRICDAWFFFLEIVLAIQDPLRFHMNFRTFYISIFLNAIGKLIWISLNL